MQRILTSSQMSQMDITTSSYYHVPSLVLMERAALAVAEACLRHLPYGGSVAAICGCGNNGADAMACARILYTRHIPVEVLLSGSRDKLSDACATQLDILNRYKIPVRSTLEELEPASVYIDGLFGNGLSREITGDNAALIDALDQIEAYKIAVDIPSGVSADNGHILGTALHCDETVTFNYRKVGHCLYPGREYCGSVVCADVGITERSMLNHPFGLLAIEDNDIPVLLPARKAYSNKGSYGKALIIAGSGSIAGAAILSAEACIHTGCGMVRVFTSALNRGALAASLPEALISTYEDALDVEELALALKWSDVVLIGPGIGTGELAEQMLSFVLEHCDVPLVMDADALNIISQGRVHIPPEHGSMIVTPHLGEMSRLTGEPVVDIKERLIPAAEDFASINGLICVLKDTVTITASAGEDTYINLSGNCGMATAGSGDVLSGMITGLIAQGLAAERAAALGVYLHGRCGDLAADRYGEYAMTASDIVRMLPEALSLPGAGAQEDYNS